MAFRSTWISMTTWIWLRAYWIVQGTSAHASSSKSLTLTRMGMCVNGTCFEWWRKCSLRWRSLWKKNSKVLRAQTYFNCLMMTCKRSCARSKICRSPKARMTNWDLLCSQSNRIRTSLSRLARCSPAMTTSKGRKGSSRSSRWRGHKRSSSSNLTKRLLISVKSWLRSNQRCGWSSR